MSTASGASTPSDLADVPVRDASTVILLRDAAAGIEVFLLERVGGMAFAGGMTVFPGGGVDLSDADADTGLEWTGPSASWWAERFGVDERKATALVCAAARETFEECGVLLAGPTADSVVSDTRRFADDRGALERREQTFGEFLTRNELVLRADLLRPWSNWITPVGEKRRYDTRFFVAVVPEGQTADGETSEAASVGWRSLDAALEDWRRGATILLPPTWSQLAGLTTFDGVDAVLAASPDVTPIQPDLYHSDGELRVDFPGQDAYYAGSTHPWADR
ncbi:NUDIX hydrolase [Rhodococcus sp. BP-252]|uniref:NUDIX hydrolase n=1 Tax=Rhodococcoides kyotonense TaxID=398843 RepID=A0A177YAV4_9NOCA|nr:MULTISPECIES: NUDIX hydrolase [Rhodococcus]MBY6411218.1 NUDIX hydrolase [Rhodococcus sp. BP-320]MBY6415877.1 NUDIX hydrolase [Rhodococcus sp. BP-321]MBY6423627.1 NUDIX hydrolase [Rhodococcus sp. BP-324]MBY6425796.1 NUDIX hydrolase [Rhodococcus sp. BP-323]MBY6431083.1 NUDIX hydrolase [Rhodococcus sp. BP-322]